VADVSLDPLAAFAAGAQLGTLQLVFDLTGQAGGRRRSDPSQATLPKSMVLPM